MTTDVLQHAGLFEPALLKTSHLPPAEREAKLADYIDWVEDQLLDLPQAPIRLEHMLVDGLYTRTMYAPAGTTLTGAVHRRACITMLISGTIDVLTKHGVATLEGPLVFPAAAGVRRLGHCRTDVVWATIHAVTATTIEGVEAELFNWSQPCPQ